MAFTRRSFLQAAGVGIAAFGFPVNVPLTDRGRMPKSINVDVGAGGPTIRATTTNGGVRVGRQSVSM